MSSTSVSSSHLGINPHSLIQAVMKKETVCRKIFKCCLRNQAFEAIRKLSKEQQEIFLLEVAHECFQTNKTQLIDRSLTFISLETLLIHVGLSEEQFDQLLHCFENCHRSLNYGDLYLSSLFSSEINQSRCKRNIHAFFETILSAFSFVRIGHEAESSWEASYILQVYGKIIAVPFLFMGLLATLSVSFTSALLITSMLTAAVVGSLFAYLKWMRPFPERVRNFHNLNSIAMRGELPAVIGRTKELDQALFLMDVGINPLVLGHPGTGKTSFIGGLAQRISSGEVPEGLKGKQIIAGNSSHLADGGFSLDGDKFVRFQSALEADKKEIIPAFDEVHALMNSQKGIGERFKSATDKSAGSFPVCIGATTPADYKRHFDAAWMRRFPALISLKPLGKEETIVILRYIQCREFLDLDVSDVVLESIYKSSSELEGYSQPDAAKIIFLKCAAHIRQQQWNTENRQKLSALKAKQTALCSLFISSIGSTTEKETKEKMYVNKAEIDGLQKKVDEELKIEGYVLRLRQQKERIVSQICFTASEILKEKNALATLNLKKNFIFHRFYYLRFLESEIKENARERPQITLELVKMIIEEMIKQSKNALEGEKEKGSVAV